MNDNRRFQKDSGVYTCECCGKRTRETGNGESMSGGSYCAFCLELLEQENCLNDHVITEAEYIEIINNLNERYHRNAKYENGELIIDKMGD